MAPTPPRSQLDLAIEADVVTPASWSPDGPRIRYLGQWRHHVVGRLRREVAVSGSAALAELLVEIDSYPGGFDDTHDLAGRWSRCSWSDPTARS